MATSEGEDRITTTYTVRCELCGFGYSSSNSEEMKKIGQIHANYHLHPVDMFVTSVERIAHLITETKETA